MAGWSAFARRTGSLVLVLLLLVVSGCTTDPPPPPTPSASSAVARTTAEPVSSSEPVRVTPAQLTPENKRELESWPDLSLAVGTPVKVEADQIPTEGIRISRSYAKPLPAGASATLAFFDPTIQTWRAVPSVIASDRLSVSAVVHHLSVWTDFVGGVSECVQAAADCAYYHVGKIFSARAEAPTCRSGLNNGRPDWVDMVSFTSCRGTTPS